MVALLFKSARHKQLSSRTYKKVFIRIVNKISRFEDILPSSGAPVGFIERLKVGGNITVAAGQVVFNRAVFTVGHSRLNSFTGILFMGINYRYQTVCFVYFPRGYFSGRDNLGFLIDSTVDFVTKL